MRGLIALMLVLTACGGSGGEPESTTSSTSGSSTTTATTTAPTTTTSLAEDLGPTDLDDGQFTVLEPGRTYFTNDYLVTIEFRPMLEGWVERHYGERFIALDNTARPGAHVHIGLHRPDSPVEEIISELVSNDVVSDSTGPTPVAVGGYEGQTVDIFIDRREGASIVCPSIILRDDRMVGAGNRLIDIEGCAWNRIWVIDVAGTAITILGTDDDGTRGARQQSGVTMSLDDFALIEGQLDDFIQGLTFAP